jgi:hypothetical protein
LEPDGRIKFFNVNWFANGKRALLDLNFLVR